MKLKKLQDPGLSEFVYTVAMTSPISVKRHLPEKYFNVVKTEKGAKKFAIESSFDQKKEFLGYLGYKGTLIISNVENIWNAELNAILKKFEKTTPKSGGDIFENDVYVTSDKALISFLESGARNMSNPAYSMSMELFRIKNGVEKWSPKLENPYYEKFKKDEKQFDGFIKMILVCSEEMSSSESQARILILLFMFLNRLKYVTREDIDNKFVGTIAKRNISMAERKLLEELMIQKSFDRTKREYTITSRGIIEVFTYIKSVVNLFNFQ